MSDFSKCTFGIVGTGLIGGSICKSLAKYYPQNNIFIHDTNLEHARLLTEEFSNVSIVKLSELKSCDFIFLCLPVLAILEHIKCLDDFSDPKTTTLIDAGSSKTGIVKALEELKVTNFVPGHPLAGGNTSGPARSSTSIIENKRFAVCTPSSLEDFHLKRATELLKSIGSIVVPMDPELHDKMLAITSHLTHILSYSLVDTLHSIENERGETSEGFRVNSFMNATFHAQSDPEMWADIIISNRTNIEAAVRKMQDAMTLYLDLAHKGDRKTLVAELKRLRHIRAEQWDEKK